MYIFVLQWPPALKAALGAGVAVPFGIKWPELGVKLSAPVLDYDWLLTMQGGL